jgi:ABC-type multidrug transport system permease subunit
MTPSVENAAHAPPTQTPRQFLPRHPHLAGAILGTVRWVQGLSNLRNVLPVLDRELRVHSRKRSTYVVRTAAVALAGLVVLPQLSAWGTLGIGSAAGQAVFNRIAWVGFAISCGCCLATSDVLSVERREGTLMLLFTTGLASRDVLFGKLFSAGVTGLCAVVALLPALMIPVVSGGVGFFESLRVGLALLDALWLSLAIGLWVSAGETDRSASLGKTLAMMLLVMLAPCSELFTGHLSVGLISPVVTGLLAEGLAYLKSPGLYWISLFLAQALAWVFIAGAHARLRSSVWERAAPGKRLETEEIDPGVALPPRPPLGETSPVEWLVKSQRGLAAALWCGCILLIVNNAMLPLMRWALMTVAHGGRTAGLGSLEGSEFALLTDAVRRSPFGAQGSWVNLLVSALGGALIAWSAARLFLSTRRQGEFEVLATTPSGAEKLLSDQTRTLMRSLAMPLVLMAGMPAIELISNLHAPTNTLSTAQSAAVVSVVLVCANSISGVAALCWLGLWFGWTSSTPARAIGRAVGIGLLTPYAVSFIWSGFLNHLPGMVLGARMSGASAQRLILPQIVTLLLRLGAMFWAMGCLRHSRVGEQPAEGEDHGAIQEVLAELSRAISRARRWTPRA